VTNNDFTVDVDTNLQTTVRIPPLATVWFERI
jgi:1,4-alpha-glucan branching enzyme